MAETKSNTTTKTKLIWYSIIIGLGLYIIPVIIYASFIGTSITNKADTWGQFGDFIGGSLNPILTIINIGVFAYLTFIVSQSEERRNKSVIESQKKITLTEMRYEEIKELTKALDVSDGIFKNISTNNNGIFLCIAFQAFILG